jgi:cytochrome c-type biogenesis protein CcmH/NrfG
MKNNLLQKISFFVVLITVFLIPLFFLPLTTNFYDFNKKILFYLSTGILLLLWGIKSLTEKKVSLKKDPLLLPLAVFWVVYLLSAVIQAPNRVFSLTKQFSTITALSLFYLAVVNLIKKEQIKWVLYSLLISSVVVSWLTIFAYLELPAQLGFGPQWLQQKTWTPTGSPLNTILLFAGLLPLSLYWAFTTEENSEKILLFVASSLQVLTLLTSISLFFEEGVQFFYLPPQYGWQICVDGLKSLRTGLLGAGPNNFLSAFNRFKPARFNTTDMWGAQFNSNSNYLFHLLSTVGVLGVGAYLWFVLKSFKQKKEKSLTTTVLNIGIITILLLQLGLSANLFSLFPLFLFLGLNSLNRRDEQWRIDLKPVVYGFAGLIAVLVVFSFYWHGRAWAADYTFRQSLLAAQGNKGLDTYNKQRRAIALQPYNDELHVSFSQTSLALANSLSQKEELSDQDKQNVTQLLSQAIQEGKVAVNLNPQKSSNWRNLANAYRQIVSMNEEAANYAVSAYSGAIRNAPTNPVLRLDLGSFYYAMQNYDRAIRQFQVAIDLKPDWANAYYNLAHAQMEKQDYVSAYQNMQAVVSLLPQDSEDAKKAQEELAELEKQLPQEQQQQVQQQQTEKSELTKPSPIPSAEPKFKDITLPEEEIAPPEVESPSPDTLEGEEATQSGGLEE